MECEEIVGVANGIWEVLGPGFSESVYHNAFETELRNRGVMYETERIIPISYKNHVIGSVRADIVLANDTVVELKSVSKLNESHRHQIGIYMKHGPFNTGVLINFPSVQAASVESDILRGSAKALPTQTKKRALKLS